MNFSLLVLPAVIALVAENAGHVKAVAEMTRRDLDPLIGRAVLADGVTTVLATSVGGSPTTTYAENIGVMAATRVYSTAAYYVAAVVAIGLGLVPEVRRADQRDPRRGARRDHRRPLRDDRAARRQDLEGEPGRLRQPDQPRAARRRHRHRRRQLGNDAPLLQITDDFSLGGIALGTIVAVVGWHVARALAPPEMRASLTREGPHPAAGSTFGHVHGAEDTAPAGDGGRGTA